MSMNSNAAFGHRLRAHRERRGVTLAALADSIKVARSLLEDLERNDVSRWPPGIYGRAILREYAKSIGLPADETLEAFREAFPEAHDRERLAVSQQTSRSGRHDAQLRLAFAGAPTQTPLTRHWSIVGAAIELALVVAIGYAVARVTGISFGTANAIVALTWYPMVSVFYGEGALTRIRRVKRLVASSWRAADAAEVAAGLMSIGTMMVSDVPDSAADALVVDHSARAEAGSVSIH
jgi:transcriptional regulator with XRE-family HTH domain